MENALNNKGIQGLDKSLNISGLTPPPQRIASVVLSLTSSNDFFFGYVAGVDFSGKLHDSSVGVLICVWIHIGFQRL